MYAELQRSGVDFTSLLQQEEEEEQQQAPQEVSVRKRTLSQNSALSQASSVHSVKDGDHLPVCTSSPSLAILRHLHGSGTAKKAAQAAMRVFA